MILITRPREESELLKQKLSILGLNSIIEPLSSVIRVANIARSGNLEVRVDNNLGIEEISRLGLSFNKMLDEISKVESLTETHDSFILNVAIGYGGRAEIVDAVKKIGTQIQENKLSVDDINEELLSNHLYTYLK